MSARTTQDDSLSFGSFTLLAKIASGDIGDLFLARSRGAGGFEKLVIIKRIHPEFMEDAEISRIFHSEAQTAARIEHPNVRIVYEIGANDAHHYIALEYLEGVPLVDVLLGRKRDRRLADPRLIAALISQACQGLHAAHKIEHRGNPLVHGDINPRSIFITESGTTKLLDFDIVEMRGALAKRHGFVRRTIAYMSPEEVRSDICDRRSDIFSLGVVAWESITGRRLFKQESRDQTLAAIDRGLIPPPKELQKGISDALNATIMRALSRDPSLRFQTAQEFGSALDRATLEEGPPLTPVAVSTLIKHSFADGLEKQRDFVRVARRNQDGTSQILPKPSFSEFERPTVVSDHPVDPDDWNSDESATTVGGEELVAAIEAMHDRGDFGDPSGASTNPHVDPFQEVSQSADFSIDGEPPIWQDTRNLVLSEACAESISAADDDEKTGAVVLANIENFDLQNYELGEAAPTLEDETLGGGTSDSTRPGDDQTTAAGSKTRRAHEPDHTTAPGHLHRSAGDERTTSSGRTRSSSIQGDYETFPGGTDPGDSEPTGQRSFAPPPSLEAPFVATTTPSSDRGVPYMSPPPSIYDRRLSTLDSSPRDALRSLPSPEVVSSFAKPLPQKRSKARYLVWVLGASAIVLVGLLLFSSDGSDEKTPRARTEPAASARLPAPSSKPASTSGAGAAAGILAAAGDEPKGKLVIPAPRDEETNDDETGDQEEEASSPPNSSGIDEDAADDDSQDTDAPRETNGSEGSPSKPTRGKSADEVSTRANVKATPKGDKAVTKKQQKVGQSKKTKANANKKVVKAKVTKPTSKGPGFLTVAASPYATVFVDGKKRGITPIVKLELTPGIHRLKLVSSAGGESKNMKVHIKSGDVVRQNVQF